MAIKVEVTVLYQLDVPSSEQKIFVYEEPYGKSAHRAVFAFLETLEAASHGA